MEEIVEPLTAGENHWRTLWKKFPSPIRMVLVFLAGLTCIIAGVMMLVLPGPGVLFIIVGFAILASEFAWAATVLHHGKKVGTSALDKAKNHHWWQRIHKKQRK